MAEEQVTQVAASAPAAVSSPLSSPAPAPSASTPAAAPDAASPSAPASPDTTSQTTRPEGLADRWWDSEKNALKVDPAQLIERDREFDRLQAAEAAENVRKGALPQKADDYKLELPADFKPPAGVEYKLDAANPAFANLRAVAHKHGLTQDAVNELIGVYAGHEVGTQAAIATARAAEIAKLGTTAPARVDAVINWLTGMDASADKGDAKALAGMLVTARHVEAFERIINKLTTQGTASFSQRHRAAPDEGIPGYEGMSFEQRRFAQDQRAAARRTA